MALRVSLLITLFFVIMANNAFAAGIPHWVIQKEGSVIAFQGTQENAPFQGVFKSFDGEIAFDPGNLAASRVDITIPVAGIDAGNTDRTEALPKAEWLNAAAFPVARFTADKFTKGLGKDRYVADGTLTLRGVSLPLTLPFTLEITQPDSGPRIAVMKGGTSLNRLDYGVGQGEWKDTDSVGNKVKITVTVTAKESAGHSP